MTAVNERKNDAALAAHIKTHLTDWKSLAEKTAERLRIAEESSRLANEGADEVRGRMQKYKGRLENAQRQVSDLTAKVVELTALLEKTRADHETETRDMRDRLGRQDAAKRKAYELFMEL